MTGDEPHGRTLWTLRREGQTVVAEVREIEGIGLELRYRRDGEKGFVWVRFRDGTDLLREAAIKRFEMEGLGWIDGDANDVSGHGVRGR